MKFVGRDAFQWYWGRVLDNIDTWLPAMLTNEGKEPETYARLRDGLKVYLSLWTTTLWLLSTRDDSANIVSEESLTDTFSKVISMRILGETRQGAFKVLSDCDSVLSKSMAKYILNIPISVVFLLFGAYYDMNKEYVDVPSSYILSQVVMLYRKEIMK